MQVYPPNQNSLNKVHNTVYILGFDLDHKEILTN